MSARPVIRAWRRTHKATLPNTFNKHRHTQQLIGRGFFDWVFFWITKFVKSALARPLRFRKFPPKLRQCDAVLRPRHGRKIFTRTQMLCLNSTLVQIGRHYSCTGTFCGPVGASIGMTLTAQTGELSHSSQSQSQHQPWRTTGEISLHSVREMNSSKLDMNE